AVEALVEVDGGGEAGDEGVDGLAEAAAPGLVGLLKAHGRTRGTGQARRLRNGQDADDNSLAGKTEAGSICMLRHSFRRRTAFGCRFCSGRSDPACRLAGAEGNCADENSMVQPGTNQGPARRLLPAGTVRARGAAQPGAAG